MIITGCYGYVPGFVITTRYIMHKPSTDAEIEQAKLEVKSYLADRNRKSVFLDAIKIDGLLHYEFEVFEYNDKPQHLVVVSLIRQGIRNAPLTPGWIQTSSSSSANEYKTFEYVLINPCTSYIAYSPITDNTAACIEGYAEGSKLLCKLEYRQDSDYPKWFTYFDNLTHFPEGTQNMKDAIRSRVFSSHIRLHNGLYYEFDVFETDRGHVVDVKSGDLTKPLSKIKVFDPTDIKPCASYRLYTKLGDLNTVGIEGYTADDKVAYTLEYNEDSIHPTVLINLHVPKKVYENTQRVRKGILKEDASIKVDKEQMETIITPRPDIKRISNIIEMLDRSKTFNLHVETYADSTCRMRLSRYSKIPNNKDTLLWSSEILTTECDCYSIEIRLDNGVNVYGYERLCNNYKRFHWNEQGVLVSIGE